MKPFPTLLFFVLPFAWLSAQTNETPLADAAETVAPDSATAPEPVAATPSSAYQIPPFETYRPIIDRMPFGKGPPVVVAPEVPVQVGPTPEQILLERSINMQAILRTPDGRTAVGFSDRSVNPAKNVYLAVGEEKDGFLLVEADYRTEIATIKKGETSITIQLGKGIVEAPVVATPLLAAAANARTTGARVTPPPPPVPVATPAPGRFDVDNPDAWPMPPPTLTAIDKMLDQGLTNSSYRERLEERRKEVLAEQANKEAADAQAIDDAAEERASEMFLRMMRRRNLDMIRNGEAGLGIPLTPEEEAMLIAEGVLQAE